MKRVFKYSEFLSQTDELDPVGENEGRFDPWFPCNDTLLKKITPP